MKKLTRQQNLQLRINHHVKTKVLVTFGTRPFVNIGVSLLIIPFVNIGVSLCDHLMHSPTTQQEENILLKRQNEELSAKLQQLGSILTRTKEELARYRVSNGKDPYEQIEEEELLRKKLDVRLLCTTLSKSYASCEDWRH